jgi:ribosome-associated protein YbcJ (S4-like RNA binding protein)
MKTLTVEKFTLQTIADAAKGADIGAAWTLLASASGAALVVAGKVRKVVKRGGQLKLVIESADVSGFIVFADCLSDAETVRNSKIRKGSTVMISGNLQSFGWSAVCLTDCRLLKPTEF